MPQGKKITEEESAKIMELLEKGIKPSKMKLQTGRSTNAIYAHLKDKGVNLSGRKPPKGQKPTYRLPEEPDYSRLPDSILFNPKMFPAV